MNNMTIRWRFFPANSRPPQIMKDLVASFVDCEEHITSDRLNLNSNEVLSKLAPALMQLGYDVETSKKHDDRIEVPVLFGENGMAELNFNADAYSSVNKTVIEVEAGRAIDNNQFLKDFFQACMMNEVEYLCIAVRKKYRGKNDYEKVCDFFRAMYASNRLSVPLKGILIIGY